MTPHPSRQPRSGGHEGLAYLITGGGSGIGRACAMRLAADGAAVTICGRTESTLADATKRIEAGAGHGGSVQAVTADVTNEEDMKAAVASAMERAKHTAARPSSRSPTVAPTAS